MIANDPSLILFRDNMLDFVGHVCDKGFSDLPGLARLCEKMRGEIDQLEVRACAIAGEQNERAKEEMEVSIPPCGS